MLYFVASRAHRVVHDFSIHSTEKSRSRNFKVFQRLKCWGSLVVLPYLAIEAVTGNFPINTIYPEAWTIRKLLSLIALVIGAAQASDCPVDDVALLQDLGVTWKFSGAQ